MEKHFDMLFLEAPRKSLKVVNWISLDNSSYENIESV